jgi:hypothetical protein
MLLPVPVIQQYLEAHRKPAIAWVKLQGNINKINEWAKKWRIEVNQNKSKHISFILLNQTCPTVQMGNISPSQKERSEIPGHTTR